MTTQRRHHLSRWIEDGKYLLGAGLRVTTSGGREAHTLCNLHIGPLSADTVETRLYGDDDWEGGYIDCRDCISVVEAFSQRQKMARRTTMKLEHVSLDKLTLEEADFFSNPREFINKKSIRELADSIEEHGLQYALRGIKRDDGTIIVVDGGRRLRAIQLLAKEKRANGLTSKVPITYVPGKVDAQGARIEALIGNLQREELSSYEVAKELHALKEAGLSQTDIAKKLNKSQSWVSRHLGAYLKAAPDVHKAWKMGKLPDDDIQTLAKLPVTEQVKRLDKMMEHRAVADTAKPGKRRAAKAAARAAAKGTTPATPKAMRPDGKLLQRMRDLTGEASTSKKYILGLHHAFRFILGEIGPNDFDKEFTEWAKAKSFGTDRAPEQKALPKAGKGGNTKKKARK